MKKRAVRLIRYGVPTIACCTVSSKAASAMSPNAATAGIARLIVPRRQWTAVAAAHASTARMMPATTIRVWPGTYARP